MSTTIDEKVVEMRFDNKHFETNVQGTLSTLDKLKQSLNLTGASKGLENVNTAANKVNFSGMSSAIETVQAKFSALQVMGITALSNITNSAINAGKRIASAFTIDPIKTGFSEYETQINAVQTILANTESKGTTLQQVNRALDELNTYADKTIYNFTEMTKNIGTFTAAGIDLNTSVSAIQGIANLAAVSGSTSQQASVAMYQLSQALSSGTVKLMDWNSVVNAGMGGQVFQDALKETARVHGIAVDEMIEENGSFRESLQEGWITSEILTETLAKFTMAAEEGTEQWETYKKSLMDQGYTEKQALNILKMANTATDAATKVKTFTQLWDTLKESAQSGWTQSWEIIVGDFGEAKEFLTNISNTIGGMLGASADARNKLLSGGLSTGWKQLLGEGIADEEGYKETLMNVAKENGFAFDELIKKTEEDGGTFNDALKKALTDGNITSDMLSTSVSKLSEKMQGMSAKEREAAGYTKEHVQQIKELDEALKNGTLSMDDFVKKMMRSSGRENLIEALSNAFTGLMNIIKPIKEAFREVFPAKTGEDLYNLTVRIKDMTARFAEFTEKHGPQIKSAFKGIFAVVDIGITIIKDIARGIGDLLKNFKGFGSGVLGASASLGDWLSNLRDSVKESNVFGKAIDKVVGFLQKAIDKIKSFAGPGFETLYNVLSGIWEFVSRIGSRIGKFFGESLREGDLLAGVEVLNAGIFGGLLLTLKNFVSDLSGSFEGIGDVLDSLKGILESYQKDLQANALLKIAGAIGILAVSLLILASIDPTKLGTALFGMTVLFGELLGSLALFSKINFNFKAILSAGTVLKSLATAILVLSVAMKIMSTISWDEIWVALLGVVSGLGALVLAVRFLPEKDVMQAAKAIRKLSTSLVIYAAAMKILASISWDEMKVALAGMAGGLLGLVVAAKLLPKDTSLAGMTNLAFSLVILAGALKILATMSWDDIGRSLSAMGIALLELAAFTLFLDSAKYSDNTKGMIKLALSMVILGGALKIMATMSWDDIGRSLAVMGGALLELVALTWLLNKAGSAGGTALAMLGFATSLILLGAALRVIGSMEVDSIIKGLVGIGAAIIIFCAAAAFLAPIGPALLSIAGAFALFGVSTLAVGVGLVIIAAGITALATALSVGATMIVAGIGAILVGIIDLIPAIGNAIGNAIIVLCQVIIEAAPLIADTILIVIAKLLESLAEYTPGIVTSLIQFIIGVLQSLRDNLPGLIVAAVEVVMAFFDGIAQALKGIDSTALLEGGLGLALITALVYMLSGIAALIPGAMVGVLGLGLVIAELALVLAAIGGLAQIPGLSWLIQEGGNFLQAIGTAIGQFIGGIVGGIALGATSTLPQVGTNLSEFMTNLSPFIEGAKSFDPSVLDSVKALVGVILAITAANVIESITSWLTGGSSISKFSTELLALGIGLKAFSVATSGIDPSALSSAASAAKTLAEMTSYIPNEGGMVAWFAGENSVASWASNLPILGTYLKAFSVAIAGMDSEAVLNAALAAKAIAEMSQCIPNEGGMAAWFAGENSVASWSSQLPMLGVGLKAFSLAIAGMDSEAVISAAGAAKAIAEMTKEIPNEGGVAAWFAGENSIAVWSSQLIMLGMGLKAFATAVTGLDSEAVAVGVEAAKSISDMTKEIPNEGGMVSWFTGDNSVAKWANQLPMLGVGIKAFSMSIKGVDLDAVTSATSAAKALAEMTKTIPNEGGMVAWFTGENSVSKFADQLPLLGKGLNMFAQSLEGVNIANISIAALGAKHLAQMTESVPGNTNKLNKFGENMCKFGIKVKEFVLNMSEAGLGNISLSIAKVKDLIGMATTVASANVESIKTFGNSLKEFAKNGVNGFVKAFSDNDPKTKAANGVKAMIDAAIKGAGDKKSDVKKKFEEIAKAAADALSSSSIKSDAKEAGKDLVAGFVNGINENTFKAEAQAKAMALLALQAAKKALGVKSPSREFYKVGDFAGQGFINALDDSGSNVYKSGYAMAESARDGLSKAISRVADLINTDIDAQPTIRPVLDLSDVESGAGYLNTMFNDGPSIGVMSNLRAITSGMNNKNQNGTNGDVVSAINKLRKDLGNVHGDTYNVNGVTYDDGSNISNAVKQIVRAVKMEGRT